MNEAIDNAFSGTNFFDTLMENETYHAQYYEYLRRLVDEYINGGGFDEFYNRVRSQIDAPAESDPNAFYSYDEYLEAAEDALRACEAPRRVHKRTARRHDTLDLRGAGRLRRAHRRLAHRPRGHGQHGYRRRWRRLRLRRTGRRVRRRAGRLGQLRHAAAPGGLQHLGLRRRGSFPRASIPRASAARSHNTASASAYSPPRSSSPCSTAGGRGADKGPRRARPGAITGRGKEI